MLRRWLQNVDGWYVQATEGTPASQRAALADDLQPLLPGFGDATYPSWRALFAALTRQWPSGKRPLVLDEFPYWVLPAPELPSVLQAMLEASDRRVPVVLCGSSQRMMQGLVLGSAAPLFGRAQLSLRLAPLPATEIQGALGLPDAISAVEGWAAFGGVPRYWELFCEGRYSTVADAIDRLVLSPHGVLHEEADRVLRDEEAASLERAVCELVGRGVRRSSELAGRLAVKETTLAKPLRHLVELGLVERQAPYDFSRGRPEVGGRRSFYRVADPFLALWYSCVRPHLSGLNLGVSAARGDARKALRHHAAAMWEELCRLHWHRLGHLDLEWEPAGRHWVSRETTGAEWDVASVSADRRHVLLGECKWSREVSRAKVEAIVRTMKQRALPPLPEGVQVHWGLFVPSHESLPREVEGVTLFDAAAVLGR